jgi:hypothetical protein
MKLQIVKSSKLSGRRYVIYGPPGAGKTRFAATWSEKWAAGGHLSDMLWLQFDVGATDTLTKEGREVDVIDLRSMMDSQDFVKFLTKLPEILPPNGAKEAGYKCVVLDTPSPFDNAARRAYATHIDADGRKGWGLVSGAHDSLTSQIGKFAAGCDIIWCMHAQAVQEQVASDRASEASKASVENTKRKVTAMGLEEIIPAVTGRGLKCYVDDASLEAAIVKEFKRVPGKPGEQEVRTLYPSGNAEFTGKSRLTSSDPIVLDSSVTLRSILPKIAP